MTDDVNPFLDLQQLDVRELEAAYHRLDVRAAQTPDGEELGYVVLASAYPQLPPDFDQQVEEVADAEYPTEAWALPVAHMLTEQEAQDYRQTFRNGTLADVVTDAGEHGLSTEWQRWDMPDISRFMAGSPHEMALTDWQPERDSLDFAPLDKADADLSSYPMMHRDFVAEAAREREANTVLEGTAWFEAWFEKSHIELLQPVNDTVNYAVVVQETDPWTRELMVEKYWKEPGGHLGLQSVTLDTWDSDDEKGREQAEQAREVLLEVHDERGLEAMMHKAELAAMQNDWLDGDRVDQRLFTQGPPDRFETLAQQLEGEINPYWHIDGEQIDDPEPSAHYWQMQHRPAQTPDRQPLGVALFVTEFPDLPPDFDAYVEQHGMDDSLYPSQARTLEVAHFADAVEARKFEAEFRGYLIPGLLDGPELAPEVAKLEGLSGEWQDLTQRDIIESMEPNRAVVRDPSDWHPYNPNAERDARIAAEGVYSDPIQQTFKRDETETASGTPELDF